MPFIETRTRTKLPWVTIPAEHRHAELPPIEEDLRLTAELARTLAP